MPDGTNTPVIAQRFTLFDREQWRALRADTRQPLTQEELVRLRSVEERIALDEVEDIYLPLSRLLNLHVRSTIALYGATFKFLGAAPARVPYIIGLAGSVAVGKSTTARILRSLLARWPNHPNVALISTDGFLHPNSVLRKRGLMERKGFPESYDMRRFMTFLSDVKAGKRQVKVPIYSHLTYDIIPGEMEEIDRPDILIVEGLAVLQVTTPPNQENVIFTSDFFDYSIYVDADIELLRQWYIERFLRFRATAFRDPRSYFTRFADLSDDEARATALSIWTLINEKNLDENIQPTRYRADLILRKGAGHRMESVAMRKL